MSAKRKKVSKASARDFLAYVAFRGVVGYDFMPQRIELPTESQAGETALNCFANKESRGVDPDCCSEPTLYRAAMEGKALLNFHVTQLWSSEIRDCLSLSLFCAWMSVVELAECFPFLPEWVWRNVWNQSTRGMTVTRFEEMQKLYPLVSDAAEPEWCI